MVPGRLLLIPTILRPSYSIFPAPLSDLISQVKIQNIDLLSDTITAPSLQEPVDNEALQLWSNAVQKLIYLTQGLGEGDKGDAELGKEFEEFKEYLIGKKYRQILQ